VLPEKNNVPASTWEMKKVVSEVGLEVEYIDACVGDCFLFRGKENENLKACPQCHEPRYHEDSQRSQIAWKVCKLCFLLIKNPNGFVNFRCMVCLMCLFIFVIVRYFSTCHCRQGL